jgi:hypothetical protein
LSKLAVRGEQAGRQERGEERDIHSGQGRAGRQAG